MFRAKIALIPLSPLEGWLIFICTTPLPLGLLRCQMASNVLPRLSFLPSRLSGREFRLTVLRFASEELDGCFKCERKMDSIWSQRTPERDHFESIRGPVDL
jgi:hypothetical protein